jgi:hypothetical protein
LRRPKFFTVPRLAELLGMSAKQCARELDKAGVPVRQRGGKRTRRHVWMDDLEAHWPEAWVTVVSG